MTTDISQHPGNTHRSRQAGFTLPEVLITITIVAIISAVAIPTYSGYRERVDLATAETDIRNLEQVIEQFYLDNKGYPENLGEINRAGLSDPWGNAYQYRKLAGASANERRRARRNTTTHAAVNTDYDLFSRGEDKHSHRSFHSSASKDDVVRARNGKFIGLVSDY